jgi:hypothetical protein
LLVVVVAAAVAGGGGAAFMKPEAGRAGAAHALLIQEFPRYSARSIEPRVTIMSLAGRRFPVPTRVRMYPDGLSPDARSVASVDDLVKAVLLGPVVGGKLREILRDSCLPAAPDIPSCSLYPSFAWKPDGARLATTAEYGTGPTLLKIFDRKGSVVRSFRLPARNPERRERAYHRVLSWSPDGSRLLLRRSDPYVDTAVVALDLRTGKLSRLVRIHQHNDVPTVVWSPNSRYVALATEGRSPEDYAFAVIEVASGRAIIQCRNSARKALCTWAYDPVWAPDSRSVFTRSNKGVVRVDLANHRSIVVKAEAVASRYRVFTTPLAALGSKVVYDSDIERGDGTVVRDTLYLYDLASGDRQSLLTSRTGVEKVRPLHRIP